ncbi:AAA family ATPase, partial [Streptomyces sp. NPDC005407]|uniref:AAA family ATPase n=1 Tax=Streptomyces sp. NPDC005407 TaxID=3155340 RepID=UPI0033A3EB9D
MSCTSCGTTPCQEWCPNAAVPTAPTVNQEDRRSDLITALARWYAYLPPELQEDLLARYPRARDEIQRRVAGEAGAARDLPFEMLSAMAAEVDAEGEATFLFEPVMVAGDYGVASAEDKAGKTWGAMDAAISAAAGLKWMGEYPCCRQGTVVYFYGEGGRRKALRRLRAVGRHKGLTDAETDALPIVMCCRAPKMKNVSHLAEIREAVERYNPVLIILDPLYLSAGGANGADLYAMGEVLEVIQRISQSCGATLLVLHHWNKTGKGGGH